ncbi:hypothetical protein PHMEG_00038084 [Phytophthora megakarya]|uniref:Uncharacterized protein n=1 Tax=Phytophthora megakarya TaxID=4795 RepID=A0A225UIH3_9STRA|nr:hypothetical protein PHMEG_00038084 [Phytophthora megakarya]
MQSRRLVDALFDPFVDDDDELPAHGNDVDQLGASGQTRGTKRSSTRIVVNYEEISAPPLDQDALIVEKLSNDPDLLNHFLQVREASNFTQNAPTQEEDNPPHELLPIRRVTDKKSGQFSKYSFVLHVGERITSEKHKDKSTTLFCKRLVRSLFIKFKPLPGVCTRLYDIQVGSCRLPICHFAPFSHDERMAWLQARSSNFDNLSSSAELTAARAPSSIDEVGDNVKVLLTFT